MTMRINDIQLTPHFKLREFQCRCCSLVKLTPKLLKLLEELRVKWGSPIIITSGYRCASHNRYVGGASGSLHLSGMAADISASPSEQAVLKKLAKVEGFTGIICGDKKNYIHVAVK
jgi:uncharacterized protein YcbK (DUF882 family)